MTRGLAPPDQREPMTGTPETPYHERPGQRTFSEKDEESAAEAFRGEMVRDGGDISQGLHKGVDFLRAGLGVRPTGQHAGTPPPPAATSEWTPASVGDVLMGVVAGGAAVGEVVRWHVRRSRKRKDKKDAK